MHFKQILVSLIYLASVQALVNAPGDSEVAAGDTHPADIKFTNVDLDSGKAASKLGVHQVEESHNEPTPEHAKKPLSHYTGENVAVVEGEEGSEERQPYDSFVMSVSMIIVSEIGDKTFLIAALMAMKHNRTIVFCAAFSALAIMTVLSGIVGHALPALLSKRITQFLASGLFVVFGYKLLQEGLAMSKDVGVDEEMAEVEEEIQASNMNIQMDNMETGQAFINTPKPWYAAYAKQVNDLAGFLLSPVFIQVFVMTFLGEWGDRSQIATIALAAGSDYWYVIIGAIIGHGVCTFAACAGGKLLAKKISMRNVTLGGAIAFFIFAILYFYEAFYGED